MDLHTAYTVIGIKENASLEELEERYIRLTETKATLAQLNDIQIAYNTIKKHIEERDPQPEESFGEKLNHFFYHHKIHLLFGVIAVALIGTFLYSSIQGQMEKKREANRPAPDIEVLLFGDYGQPDLALLEDKIQALFPEWGRIEINVEYAPGETNSELDIGAIQKNQITMMSEQPDILIFDVHNFNKYRDSGVMIPLDILALDQQTEDREILHQKEEDEHEQVYGIDLSNHEFFSGLSMASNETIATIRLDGQNRENAVKLLNKLLE